MIVCVCRAVSDRMIRAAIAGGARSMAELSAACRAGTSCGACCSVISDMLNETGGRGELCNTCPAAPKRTSSSGEAA